MAAFGSSLRRRRGAAAADDRRLTGKEQLLVSSAHEGASVARVRVGARALIRTEALALVFWEWLEPISSRSF